MGRRASIHAYCHHKPSGQTYVTLRDLAGNRHFVYLGPHDTEESHAEYRRVLVEWEASGRRLPVSTKAAPDITVNELAVAYLDHAERHYVKDGDQTNQLDRIRLAIRVLRSTHGHTLARDFGPKSLKMVRANMLSVPCSICKETGIVAGSRTSRKLGSIKTEASPGDDAPK